MDARLQYFALCSLMAGVFVVSCGDSGGGGGDTPPIGVIGPAAEGEEPEQPGVSLTWSLPETRLDGQALHKDEISAYAVVYVSDEEIATGGGAVAERIGTRKAFRDKLEQLGQFISRADLRELVVSGSPGVILVPAPQTRYRLEELNRGTYHVAVSAYDWMGLYSPLSDSLKIVLPMEGGRVITGE